MPAFTNHLAGETSPYLLQHAHNPVNWYPWGEEALTKAKKENKPILVSIGYAACHWCHVMERESFENEETADVMNRHFINIKIDREERPDLDHIYMDAVQTMTGSGGWPLNVFLTPDGKPFYGGTYFPPQRAFNRASWKEILLSVSQAFRDKRAEIETRADDLTQHLENANNFGFSAGQQSQRSAEEMLTVTRKNILQNADTEEGGFGKAPKFPHTFAIRFLLRDYSYSNNEDALRQALLSLDKMCMGGLYDQIGGGFARYSTDEQWLAPHFEKMLYDNALLVIALSEAYQITKDHYYHQVITETLQFVKRELLSPENGFYSALDADSEGEEGKFYVWQKDEFDMVLGPDATLVRNFFDVTQEGNWEEKNILRLREKASKFAQNNNISEDQFINLLTESKKKLLSARANRVRPLLDDKILLGWNALMNQAFSIAFMATGKEEWKQIAMDNMEFVLQHFKDADGGFRHTYKNGKAKLPAFLDDYASLVQALISLQEITGDEKYLEEARAVVEYVIAHFSDEKDTYFYYTGKDQRDVIVRKKEIYDGATPSGNSLMAHNLLYLSVVFNIPEWKERARLMVNSLSEIAIKHPHSFGVWASLLQALVRSVPEIVLTGSKISEMRKQILAIFIPYRVFQSTGKLNSNFPLLNGKPLVSQPLIYLCKDFACLPPVNDLSSFVRLLKTG